MKKALYSLFLISLLVMTSCSSNTKSQVSKETNTNNINQDKANNTTSDNIKSDEQKKDIQMEDIKLPSGLKDKELFSLEKQIYPILEKSLKEKKGLTKEDIQVYEKFNKYLGTNFPDNKTEYDIVRCFQDAHQEAGRITMDILDEKPQKVIDYESEQGLMWLDKVKNYFEN
ncbi:hypothetical protein JHL18_01545 [Clostridium sp. YIM B02505]|uniref:Lipoprotein n=1 Tax=Clostridium yunnanense TaxID=2800325 RepID=A0ABS1EIY9_9CLOT|nr:hypothetical protein [Clostridium yunnanense]MBK1809329.1 hypothetical protein [Clostridium yunnanense]